MQQPFERPTAEQTERGPALRQNVSGTRRAARGARRQNPSATPASSNGLTWPPHFSSQSQNPPRRTRNTAGLSQHLEFSELITFNDPVVYVVSQILRARTTLLLAPDQSDEIMRTAPAIISINQTSQFVDDQGTIIQTGYRREQMFTLDHYFVYAYRRIMYGWVINNPQERISFEAELALNSNHTTVDWSQFCRDICIGWCQDHAPALGGIDANFQPCELINKQIGAPNESAAFSSSNPSSVRLESSDNVHSVITLTISNDDESDVISSTHPTPDNNNSTLGRTQQQNSSDSLILLSTDGT
ncbi:unnamed protein product [Anisakis simplex]|uniref:Capsid protein n=1 Tax=Anisakis simplex TaxID=6269 RepID=A0A0M3JQZ8_ANISI|nr:unnamed protein product [Anisakis simplex]